MLKIVRYSKEEEKVELKIKFFFFLNWISILFSCGLQVVLVQSTAYLTNKMKIHKVQ